MQIRTQLSLTEPGGGDARCAALFASVLQPSDAPAAGMIAAAIRSAVQRLGPRGCAGRVAQEFGDHPDAAARRMRRARQVAAQDSAARRCDGQPGRAAARRSGPKAALPALPAASPPPAAGLIRGGEQDAGNGHDRRSGLTGTAVLMRPARTAGHRHEREGER